MNPSPKTLPPAAIVIILLSTFLWGTAFPVGKIALNTVGPLTLAGMRFTLAGCLVLASSLLFERREWGANFKYLLRREVLWGKIILIAFMSTCVFYGMFFLGLNMTSGGSAAAVDAAGPLISALFAHFALHEDRLNPRKLLAIGLCFSGILVVTLTGRTNVGATVSAVGCLLILIGLVFNSAGTMLVVRYSGKLTVGQLTAFQMTIGGIGLLIWAWVSEGLRFKTTDIPASFYLSVVYLATVSAVAFRLWYGLIRKYKVTSLSAFSFLTGGWGALLSIIFLDEKVTAGLIVGLLLIFIGVQVMVRDRSGLSRSVPVTNGSA